MSPILLSESLPHQHEQLESKVNETQTLEQQHLINNNIMVTLAAHALAHNWLVMALLFGSL